MDFTNTENKIYLVNEKNELLAEVTFPDMDETTVDINHTYVSEMLRGQGVAGKLMAAAAEQIQAQNKKAVLSCSYAQKWFQEHPEYKHLIADAL